MNYAKKIAVIVLIFTSFILSGCNGCDFEAENLYAINHPYDIKEKTIKNVVRIFMHLPEEYTFMTKEPDSSEYILHHKKVYYNYYGRQGVKIFTDVKKEETMWAKIIWIKKRSIDPFLIRDIEMHLHSEKNIDGGGWERYEGKQLKKGVTSVIE